MSGRLTGPTVLEFRDLLKFSSWRDWIELQSEGFFPGLQHLEMWLPLIRCWLSWCETSEWRNQGKSAVRREGPCASGIT